MIAVLDLARCMGTKQVHLCVPKHILLHTSLAHLNVYSHPCMFLTEIKTADHLKSCYFVIPKTSEMGSTLFCSKGGRTTELIIYTFCFFICQASTLVLNCHTRLVLSYSFFPPLFSGVDPKGWRRYIPLMQGMLNLSFCFLFFF